MKIRTNRYAIFIYLSIFTLVINSCVSIRNRESLMDINDIEYKGNELKLNGYYYGVKEFQKHPFIASYIDAKGYFKLDSSKVEYKQIKIYPVILYSNGTIDSKFSYNGFSGYQDTHLFNLKKGSLYKEFCSLDDKNTIESALKHFECFLKHKPKEKHISKKQEVWRQGVFKIKDSLIKVQLFHDMGMGNFTLIEENGVIKNDTTFVLKEWINYHTGEKGKMDIEYHFRKTKQKPKFESYILKKKKYFRL